MKREGRQHGLVRTHPIIPSPWNPKPNSRYVNKLNSPPTAGLFTKASPKPSNHSKFTGKCGRSKCTCCHIHPAGKAKDKAKGTQKLRGCDIVSRPGLTFYGFSAISILDH
ncbi:uncharacterized protein LOC132038088 [Lycium ferocissimum]|uniref:uncharacterized protein LOC132038088 n=1 Tax=Lycium ferocissimum TaxID=112874 RepID=UPI0028159808|nr:uncharacterized protein LOC132038088 [Lycium ferocissimum]